MSLFLVSSFIVPIKNFTPDGCFVIVVRVPYDVHNFDPKIMMKRGILNVESGYKLGIPHSGYVLIFDVSTCTISHSMKVPLSTIKEFLTCFLVS